MGAVITLTISAYFFLIAYRLKYAYISFIFIIPFIPKYIGFGVGGEGFALSLKRILLMILFMAFALSFMQNTKYISQRISSVYEQNSIMMNFILLFFIIKIFSLTINDREISQYISLFDDFLASIFIMLLTILVIDSEEAIHRLMKVFFYAYTIVLILVLIESILKQPILTIFASGKMQFARDFSEGLYRHGQYRTIGGFENPIVLGNYIVAFIPFIITYLYINKYKLIVKLFYILLIIYVIFSTGSRSAILMALIIVYIYINLLLYKKGNQIIKYLLFILNFIMIVIVIFSIIYYVNGLITNFSGRFDKISDEEERSSIGRALQYISIYDKMHQSPFIGFGRKRNFTSAFVEDLNIDNYFFWVILEVGLIGIIMYLLFFYYLIRTAWNLYKSTYENAYLLPIMISVIILILYQVLSAVKDNHVFLYVFAGLVSVMKVLQKKSIN